MNRSLLLACLLITHYSAAMEKEVGDNPLDEIAEMTTFLDACDSKKSYDSNSNEIQKIVPPLKALIARLDADRDSKENGYVIINDSNFKLNPHGPVFTMGHCCKLAVVKKNGKDIKTLDDINDYVLTFDQLGKLRVLIKKMNKISNISEKLHGDKVVRKELVAMLNKLDEIYQHNGITIESHSLNKEFKKLSKNKK